MLKVTNCELNASTAKAMAKRVMKDRNMRVAERFVPAESTYVVNLDPKNRIRISLSDNSVTSITETKIGDNRFIKDLHHFKGSFDAVQERFYAMVKDINKAMNK